MHTPEQTNSPTPPTKETVANRGASRREMAKLILIAVLIVIPFRFFIAQPFIVDGASMDPTFKNGQYLVVDKLSYRFSEPERGSVLIFKYPRDERKYFIKRVIGLPGETIAISGGRVTVTNDDHPQGFVLDEPYIEYENPAFMSPYTLGEGEYFVLGDNRYASADSRVWGPVPEDNIVGRPMLRVYPPALIPGDYSSYEKEDVSISSTTAPVLVSSNLE